MEIRYQKTEETKSRDELQDELHLKELQLRSLLTITQAINDNVSASGLFDMYRNFLAWEMGVQKMALFTTVEDQWEMVVSIHVDFELDYPEVLANLHNYQRLHTITADDHPLIREFDILIPVNHKDHPIAYTLIGGIRDESDLYSKIQFITTITNVIAVAIENKRLFKQQLQQQRLEKEVELAEEVQQMLIPEQLPSNNRYNMASIYKPHFNVGGDYFDYIPLDEDRFVFCIADISGKGVGAAILMANFQAVLKVMIPKLESLEDIVTDLNENIYELTKSDKFITFFIALVDTRLQQIDYVNAGHNPPLIAEHQAVSKLDVGCTVLGAVPRLPVVQSGRYEYSENCMIVAFTDGLIDILNEKGEHFDQSMLEAFLLEQADVNATEFNSALYQRLEAFRGQEQYPDDVAILSCQITPDGSRHSS